MFVCPQDVVSRWPNGDNGIPQGWTVQKLDPDTGEIVNEYINE